MKFPLALFLLTLVGFHLTVPLGAQVTFYRQPTIQEALKRWADPETVEQWTQAMRAGWQGIWQGKLNDAEASFRRAALYVRAARIHLRLGRPERAAPLFREEAKIFEQPTLKREDLSFLLGRASPEFPNYRGRHHRTAEVDEAECRFLLARGQDDQALQSLQQAEDVRTAAAEGQSAELFVDQLVVEPLDKSFLGRFLEDCAFYRFDDQQIAGLLDRQAVLLKKVGRVDESVAFEKFAESLRKKPLSR